MSHSPTVIVTGGASGIGRAVAERLGAAGAAVVVNYRSDAAAAESVAATIRSTGGAATAVHADIAVPEQVSRLFDTARERFGDPDVVVHSAAVTHFTPLADATDADYDRVCDANIRSTFTILRAAATRLPDDGRIIVISSGAAVVPRATAGLYAASKAAGDQLVRVLATELAARCITVNSVRPGPTRTEKVAATVHPDQLAAIAAGIPLGRLAEPADIADIVAFLASDAARWITGQTLHAGGGHVLIPATDIRRRTAAHQDGLN